MEGILPIVENIFFNVSEDSDVSTETSESEEDTDVMDEAEIRTIYAAIMLAETRGNVILQPRILSYVENVVGKFTAQTFKSHFRMLPDTFEYVLNLIGNAISETKRANGSGRKPIESEKQLLIALWYMGTPDSYRSVLQKFNIGKATAIRAVRRVTYALHCLAPRLITWPKNESALVIHRNFERKYGFPGVIGAIDGTHIRIDAPRDDPQSYVSRKDVHVVHLQAVCDDRAIFTHCVAGNAASVHDARVIKHSRIFNYLSNPEEYFPNDSHIIGDSAYGIHEHLMTPFRDNGHLTVRQKNYNRKLSAARQVIERAFGLLKGRFRSLRDKLPLVDMKKIPEFILACCVLHNICMEKRDELPEEDVAGPDLERVPININDERIRERGKIKRERIKNELV